MDVELALEAALRHAREGTREPVLASLLEAWRIARAAEIAELIELVSSQLTKREPPLRATNRKTTAEDVWLAAAREQRPARLERLLEGALETRYLVARLRVLRDLPPDPRTAAWAARALQYPPWGFYDPRTFFDGLLAILDHVLDPRLLPTIGPLMTATDERAFPERSRESLAAHRDALRAVPTAPLSERATAMLDAVRELVLAGSGSAAPFFASVYEDPTDDDARSVLGDLLQQRGDPRGEHIALQLARAKTGKRRTSRETQLERMWAHDWLGALAPALDNVVFERGFPAWGRWRHGREAEATLGIPEWATISHLDLNGTSRPSFALGPTMRSLRHVTGISLEGLRPLRHEAALPWTSLGVRSDHGGDRIVREMAFVPRTLPALTRLLFEGQHLSFRIPVPALAELLERSPSVERLAAELPAEQIAALLSMPSAARLQYLVARDRDVTFSFDRDRKRITVRASSGALWVGGALGHFAPLRPRGIVDTVDFHFGSHSVLHEEGYVAWLVAGGQATGLTVMAFGKVL